MLPVAKCPSARAVSGSPQRRPLGRASHCAAAGSSLSGRLPDASGGSARRLPPEETRYCLNASSEWAFRLEVAKVARANGCPCNGTLLALQQLLNVGAHWKCLQWLGARAKRMPLGCRTHYAAQLRMGKFEVLANNWAREKTLPHTWRRMPSPAPGTGQRGQLPFEKPSRASFTALQLFITSLLLLLVCVCPASVRKLCFILVYPGLGGA